MDRLVFAAMTGARSALGQMAITANNLANASTPGFREQIAAFRAVPMGGDGANTRAFALDTTPGSNSVEEANTDMAGELVRLMVQQRNYQANAQSIRTQVEILSVTIDVTR